MLTTSDYDPDRTTAYDLGVNSYMTKPIDYERFQNMVRELDLYWSVWNEPPVDTPPSQAA